jgi:hypothetical protein
VFRAAEMRLKRFHQSMIELGRGGLR